MLSPSCQRSLAFPWVTGCSMRPAEVPAVLRRTVSPFRDSLNCHHCWSESPRVEPINKLSKEPTLLDGSKFASTTSDHGAVYCGRAGKWACVNPLSNIFLLGYSVSKSSAWHFQRALLCFSLGKINNANQDFLCLFTCCQVSSISSLNSTRRKFRAGYVSNSLTDSTQHKAQWWGNH